MILFQHRRGLGFGLGLSGFFSPHSVVTCHNLTQLTSSIQKKKIISVEFPRSVRANEPTRKQLGAITAPSPDTARPYLKMTHMEFENPLNLVGLNSSKFTYDFEMKV